MRVGRLCTLFCVLAFLFALAPALAGSASDAVTQDEASQIVHTQSRNEYALLIGVDYFVSRAETYPSSTNNVNAMQEVFQGALNPFRAIIVPPNPVTTVEQLTALIQKAFGAAQEGDVCYLYLSTHGVYDPASGQEPMLLLSDGQTENGVTPAQLEAAFDGILGTKVLILDACNSGAFIGKGLPSLPEEVHFLGDDFKVLTSSGALEESWYWSVDDQNEAGTAGQGSFYFTQALVQSLSAAYGYPADQNRDGCVVLSELYEYLVLNHAASTPQVYPQSDDFVVFRYDASQPLPTGLARAPIMDVTFSGTTLSRTSRQITIEFIAMRPVRVAYQVVYQRDGKWEFDHAQLIYDEAERFTAYGDQPGAISAGRKVRTLTLGELDEGVYGYAMVQLVTIDQGKLTVHAGRVISIPPDTADMTLTASVADTFDPSGGRELSIFIGHEYPCALSVSILDEEEQVVHRLCHRQSTRPMQMNPEGTVLYWNGRLKDGAMAEPGVYRVRAEAVMNDTTVTVLSSAFTIQ